MGKAFKILFLLVCVVFAGVSSAYSQDNEFTFMVTGRVYDNLNNKLTGVKVTIKQNGKIIHTSTSSSNGKINGFEVPFGYKYVYSYEKPGYTTIILDIDAQKGYYSDDYIGRKSHSDSPNLMEVPEPKITLFKKVPNIDYSAIESKPRAKMNFSSGLFDFDGHYINSRKTEIDNFLDKIDDQLEQIEQEYRNLVSSGDKAYTAKKYDEALTNYKKALAIKPDSKVIQENIAKTEQRIKEVEEQKRKQAEFDKIIKEGDNLFSQDKLDEAEAKYKAAQSILPTNSIPNKKISEINKRRAELEAIERKKQFDAIVASADKLFQSKQINEAKLKYQEALVLLPSETYPKQQIAEIERQIQERKRKEAEYAKLVSEGDQLIAPKQFDNAISKYNSALAVLPEKSEEIKQKIARVEEARRIEAERLRKEKQYDELITSAEKALELKQYDSSIDLFTKAINLFSDRPLPKERIAFAKQLKAKEEEERRRKEQFNALIDKADNAFDSKSFENARDSYSEALKIYPDDSYAQKKHEESIQKIREIEEEKRRLAAIEKQYNDFMRQGDEFKTTEKYTEAIKAFEGALTIKPNDVKATQKISEINKILKQIEEEKQKRIKYDAVMADAARAFNLKDYQTAITKYQEAINLFPNEQYPQEQLNISKEKLEEKLAEERRLAELKKKKEDYDNFILKADDYFASESYEDAISFYQKAKTLFPSETYPGTKISESENILRKRAEEEAKLKSKAERDAEYTRLIESGDQMFSQENYEQAKLDYNNAIALNDTPELRKKIAEADRMISVKNAENQSKAEEQQLNELYSKIISDADNSLESGDLFNAKKLYQKALTYKNEEYPKNQIKKIDDLIKKQAEEKNNNIAESQKRKEFEELLSNGDNALNEKNFDSAIAFYNQAKNIYQDDPTVNSSINNAEKLREEYEASKLSNSSEDNQTKYDNYITLADNAFKEQDYNRAISKYQQALSVFSDKEYPKNQIKLSQGKLDEISSLNQSNLISSEYNDQIKIADDYRNKNNLKQAKKEYEAALNIKPKDTYALNEISRINKKFKEQEENKTYQKLINNGDSTFDEKKYVPAKGYYTDALDIKPSDIYPKERIDIIDEILGAEIKTNEVSNYNLDGYQEVENLSEEEILAMMNESADDNSYSRPQISENTENQNTDYTYERILSNQFKTQNLEEQYNDLETNSDKKELKLDGQRVVAINDLEKYNERSLQTEVDWAEKQRRETAGQDEYNQQIETDRQNVEIAKDNRRERVLEEYENNIDKIARDEAELKVVSDLKRSEVDLELSVNEQDRMQKELESDYRRESFISEVERIQDDNIKNDAEIADEAGKKNQALSESYDLIAEERAKNELELDKQRALKNEQLTLYNQNQKVDDYKRIERTKTSTLANQDASNDVETRIAKEAIKNDESRVEVIKEYELYEDQRTYLLNDYSTNSNEKSLNNEAGYNDIETQRSEAFVDADKYRIRANRELALYQDEANQNEVDVQSRTDIRNNETSKDFNNLETDAAVKTVKSDERRERAVIDTENSDQINIDQNSNQSEFAKTKTQSISDQNSALESKKQENAIKGTANQEKNSYSINQYEDQNTNTSASNQNQAENKNLNTSSAMDEEASKSPTYMSDQMTDNLALKYPEGVTEKKYTSKNAQGKVTGYVIIRIVVKGNKGVEYKKDVTQQITRFYKNGTPITEDVWDKETSGPQAE